MQRNCAAHRGVVACHAESDKEERNLCAKHQLARIGDGELIQVADQIE